MSILCYLYFLIKGGGMWCICASCLIIIVITLAASSRFSTSGTSEYFVSCFVLFCSVVQYLSLVCVHILVHSNY